MKHLFAALCLSLLPLAACSSTHSYHADSTLLVPWSAEAQRALPEPPYAARYEHEGKRLTFVASRHEHRPGCETFAVVAREVELLDPQFVIIEGLSRERGVSPEFYAEWVKEQVASEEVWPGGEAAFVVSLALERGVPFVGAEPGRREQLDEIAAGPYELRDFIYYVTLRQVPQWKRTEADAGKAFEELYAEFMRQCEHAYELDVTELSDPDDFRRWYEEKNGSPFVYDEITTQQCAPIESDRALFTNRLSARIGAIRDAHITGVIADILNSHDRVLVVYGAGHHVQQARVLEKMLGPPCEMQRSR